MTHLIVLKHSLEHHSSNKEQLTSYLQHEKIIDIDEDCSLCNIYLEDVELSKAPIFTYIILAPKLLTDIFLVRTNSFKSIVFSIKKSRAPPYFSA